MWWYKVSFPKMFCPRKWSEWLTKRRIKSLNPVIKEFSGLREENKKIAENQEEYMRRLKQNTEDISLQIEEIYDIIKENAAVLEIASSAKKRETALLNAVMGMNDIIDGFSIFAEKNPGLAEQAYIIKLKSGSLLSSCGVVKYGTAGDKLDFRLHDVYAAEISEYPFEHISKVIQSGYIYNGETIRKAGVLVSKGEE